jgi:hypothetical protein
MLLVEVPNLDGLEGALKMERREREGEREKRRAREEWK